MKTNNLRNSVTMATDSAVNLVTSERGERSSYQQSHMGRLDDIKSALKSLKKIVKN